MLRRTTLLALVPFTLGLLALTLPSAQDDGTPRGGARGAKSELGETMEAINAGVRTVARGRADGASAENLAALAGIQTLIVAAKSHVPTMLAEEADAAKQAAELQAFRIEMNALLREFLDLEDALLQGDAAAAEAALEKLGAMKDAGHERFKPRRGGR
jgi:soluble cytochrome b562